MSAKASFLKNEELAKYWVTVAHDPRFELVLIHARASLMESRPNQEQTTGAEQVLDILSTLADNEGTENSIPSPGLHHLIDKMPPRPEP